MHREALKAVLEAVPAQSLELLSARPQSADTRIPQKNNSPLQQCRERAAGLKSGLGFLIGIKGQIAQNAESEQRGGTAREEQALAAGGAQGAGAQPARGEAERQQGQQGREQQQGGVAAPGGGEVARGERAQHPRHPAAGTVQAGESRLAFAKKS